MRNLRALLWLVVVLTPWSAAGQADTTSKSDRVCPQVITCGTKDGERKEYPTPCAAEDDGATDIAPKTGSSCSASK